MCYECDMQYIAGLCEVLDNWGLSHEVLDTGILVEIVLHKDVEDILMVPRIMGAFIETQMLAEYLHSVMDITVPVQIRFAQGPGLLGRLLGRQAMGEEGLVDEIVDGLLETPKSKPAKKKKQDQESAQIIPLFGSKMVH